jgi:hypothetical protein
MTKSKEHPAAVIGTNESSPISIVWHGHLVWAATKEAKEVRSPHHIWMQQAGAAVQDKHPWQLAGAHVVAKRISPGGALCGHIHAV